MIQSGTPEAMMDVSRLPRPVRNEDLLAAIARHYPADLRAPGVAGSVLVDVRIEASGEVSDVRVVHRDTAQFHRAVLTRRGHTGTPETIAGAEHDERFGEAAIAALREVRFTPAMRENAAVPFTMRMTIGFDEHLPKV